MVIGYVVYSYLKGRVGQIFLLYDITLNQAIGLIGEIAIDLGIRIALVYMLFAFLDYVYQKRKFKKDMKMTKEEVKEEYKQMEGDPKVKSKIRSIQQQRARSRMMQAVPDADVIIRNPTHYAVALKYDIDHDNAPILIAKGQDSLALKIVEIGEENGVTVLENKPLARGLYASTPVDGEIPAEYYGVVAEILVEIFRMNKKMV